MYLTVCALVDFVPYFGPPSFRYTGSDPAFKVWNFGFPLASVIFDSRNGLHVGPLVWLAVLLQALLFVGLVVVASSRSLIESTLFTPVRHRLARLSPAWILILCGIAAACITLQLAGI